MKKSFKKASVFTVICLGISFAAAALFDLLGGKYASLAGTAFASAYMMIPLISVVITQLIFGEEAFSNCGIRLKVNRWWYVAWLGMPLMVVASVLVSTLLPGVGFTLDSDLMKQSIDSFSQKGTDIGPWGILGITAVSGLIAGITINALFAFGEEIAWRGFLARCLSKLGFWKKSLLIGVIWGVWHAPLILKGHNYPSHPEAGVFMMIVFCTLLSPVFMYLRERSHSVLSAAIAHGTMNAFAGLALILLTGYNDMLCGLCGAAGFVVLLIIDVVIFAFGHPEESK